MTINMWASREEEYQLTGSLNTDILGAVLFLPPAGSVSPAQGLASTAFSFLRSANEPILSHPFEPALIDDMAEGWASSSEKIASLDLEGLPAPPLEGLGA